MGSIQTAKCALGDCRRMGSKKFTFIELHLDGDTQFGPKAIGEAVPALGAGTEEFDSDDSEDEDAGAADDSSGKPIAALVGLVLFVGAAIAFKKLRGGDDEEIDDLEERDEPDVIVN